MLLRSAAILAGGRLGIESYVRPELYIVPRKACASERPRSAAN